jgi:excisionase family DNA binding protein
VAFEQVWVMRAMMHQTEYPAPSPTLNTTVVGDTRPDTPWMSAVECAGYLGVAVGTVRNWTSARFIPFSKRGGLVRYHRDRIDQWLARGACPGRATLADA